MSDVLPLPPALGATVRPHSLAGRPKLNGKRGKVVAPFASHSGHVGVKVDGEEGEEPVGIDRGASLQQGMPARLALHEYALLFDVTFVL